MTDKTPEAVASNAELGPLPEPWRAGDLKPDTQVYTADTCWFYAARAVAAERERYAPLMQAVEQLMDAGHMNQENLARLRAAWDEA